MDFVLGMGGVYLSAEVSLAPTSLTFANAAVGVPVSKTAVLTNSERTSTYVGEPLIIDSVGSPTDNFTEIDNCNGRLPAGASCTLTITLYHCADGLNFHQRDRN